MPFMDYDSELKSKITKLAYRAHKLPLDKKQEISLEIDTLVYDLYGLTEEEVGVVEGVG